MVFLIIVVCDYLKLIHSGEKPLEIYKENSSLDEVIFVSDMLYFFDNDFWG